MRMMGDSPMMYSVHLVTFHQSIMGINDQILFLRLLFAYKKVPFSIGSEFRSDALNLMIEAFDPKVCERIGEFHARTGKRIAIIATEHLDYRDGTPFLYNENLWAGETVGDYIDQSTSIGRFAGLLEASKYATALIALGDLPRLNGVQSLLPRLHIVHLPFPPLKIDQALARSRIPARCDAIFTGSITQLRRDVLGVLEKEISIRVIGLANNQLSRAKSYLSASLALNIPQYSNWIWSSPMRILYGLSLGRLTMSVLLEPGSAIDAYSIINQSFSLKAIKLILEDNFAMRTASTIETYQAFAESQIHTVPDEFFASWAELERVGSRA